MERPSSNRTAAGALLAVTLTCVSIPAARAQVAANALEPARAAIRLKDYAGAIARLQPLAEHGDRQAQYLLGSLYRIGLGTAADQSRARALLLSAAQGNHAGAAYSVATMLANEEPRDATQAMVWLKRAADAGYPPARATMQRGSLPLQFLPQKDLGEADSRCAALWLAAQRDDVDLVAALAEGETLRCTNDFGRGALAMAAESGAANSVTVLLERGAQPNQADEFGITPLMLAVRSADAAALNALLSAQAAVNAVDKAGNSALMHAASAGNERAVQRLLQAGADFSLANRQGWSVLDWAVHTDSPAIAQLLRQRGLSTRRNVQRIAGSPAIPLLRAAAPAVDLYRGVSDLQVAASRSTPALLKEVIRSGREADRATMMPEGVLFAAAVTGSPATIEAALAAGAGPATAPARDPLSWLVMRGEPDAVATLLAQSKGIAEKRSESLLAAVNARRAPIVRMLLDRGADTEVRDAAGRTPLMLAAAAGQADIAGLLLSHLARMEPTDELGRTALWYASAAGAGEIVDALLRQKSVLDTPDTAGFAPLSVAVARGHAVVVQSLLDAGAKVATATRSGSTPLMLAAQGGHEAAAGLLLAAGASVDGQNRYGDTALIVAVRAGQADMVRQLLKAGASDKLRNADRTSALDVATALDLSAIAALLQQD